MTARSTTHALAALALGIGAGFACGGGARSGSTLPRAGSDDDDGTGFVARMSRGQHPRNRPGETPRGEDVGELEGYGGDWYGGGAYGGGIYGAFGAYYPPPTAAPSPIGSGYTIDAIVESGRGGAIDGVVAWKGNRAPASLPAPAQATRCKGGLENLSLRVSPSGGLLDAVVFLADIRNGKAPPPSVGGTLELSGCRFAPVLQLAMPIGQVLTLTNRDDAAAQVRLTRRATTVASSTGEAVSDVNVAARGEAGMLLDRDAAFEATLTGGQPGVSSWVVVPPHPYYVLTDEQGRFRLDDVPPGEYTLVVWHPPVITGVDAAGVVQRTTALETRTRVKVEERKTSTIRVEVRQ